MGGGRAAPPLPLPLPFADPLALRGAATGTGFEDGPYARSPISLLLVLGLRKE
jgi:hypothetical protein